MLTQIWILCAWVIPLITRVQGSWGAPGTGQYHIQTDEGPERYFRFQTDNGQFRKEKRLQDGTVIGTEAWIDAAGYLRQKDYIADKNGYRILKSKTIFVGQNRPIEDAIKSAKTAPAQSGVLVDSGNRGSVRNSIHGNERKYGGYVYSTPTPAPVLSTTTIATPILVEPPLDPAPDGKLNYLSPAEAANIQPSGYLGFDHYPDELPRAHAQAQAQAQAHELRSSHQPHVFIRPHSVPLEQAIDEDDDSVVINEIGTGEFVQTSSTPRPFAPPPVSNLEAPFQNDAYRKRLQPIAVINPTPTPIRGVSSGSFSTPAPFGYDYGVPSSTVRPYSSPVDVNQLDNVLLPPLLPPSMHTRRLKPPSAAEYDGVSHTRDGFRYFLPRQYHEEEQFNNGKRAGSYGYVDPFGIRRVVYYNASPDKGFVHRNNNRFVGLGGAPFDPPGPEV